MSPEGFGNAYGNYVDTRQRHTITDYEQYQLHEICMPISQPLFILGFTSFYHYNN